MPKKLSIVVLLILVSIISLQVDATERVSLEINGDIVTDDLDYKLLDEDILIPLHNLTDNLPIKVRWFSAIETLQLETEERVVKLRIGDPNLQVSQQMIQVPVAAELVDDQPMVPLNALGDILGLVIDVEPDDNIVKISETRAELEAIDYVVNDDYEGLKVTTNEPIDYQLDLVREPYRIAFDLERTALNQELDKLDLDSQLVEDVRVAQFDARTTRVVLDLFANVDYQLQELESDSDDQYKYLLRVSPIIKGISHSEEGLKVDATRPLQASSVSYLSNPQRAVIDIKNAALAESQTLEVDDPLIEEVRMSQYQTDPNNIVRVVLDTKDNTKVNLAHQDESLLIKSIKSELEEIAYSDTHGQLLSFDLTERVEPEVMPLAEGSRLVFDFPDTNKEMIEDQIDIDSELVKGVRSSQFSDDKTRVVVDLEELVPYELDWEGTTLQVSLMNRLLDLETSTEGLKTELGLSLLAPTEYEVYKLYDPYRLVVDLENTVVDTKQLAMSEKLGMVNDVRVSQFSADPKQVRVVFDLDSDVTFEVESDERTQDIDIKLNRFNLKDRIIVVDAGHGGYDPGAISPSGLREKDVVLDISLILEELLKDAGAKVVMTRRDDHFVSLPERSEIANSLDADLFISVHANSHTDERQLGTETYIVRDADKEEISLAEYIQQNKVERLETHDRGVKKNNLSVLRNTEIPAVLSEVAFLSNPEDEKLLKKDSFKQEAAIALYKGISQYFELLLEEEL
ncbi:N-acetylmuramoyl-L-alanine amidase family protein [Natroniella sulfidigena]|uniref:N-acetylmuramoyl-L-alanine amidase family protein n=1 Tax=Natroniella sulfidigena TaxID=723921 RepID=UPI00200A0EC6|nr:N-acetylmuramoyl-L-alanine amidase family protein [Natroniella sulfidigena]MCK8817128.1 N-acetylmuramoyl-L-alanine amidase family protein [Natroniella sulfidigena]